MIPWTAEPKNQSIEPKSLQVWLAGAHGMQRLFDDAEGQPSILSSASDEGDLFAGDTDDGIVSRSVMYLYDVLQKTGRSCILR